MSRITVARQVRSSPHDCITDSLITCSLGISGIRSSHSPRQTRSTSNCSTEVNPPRRNHGLSSSLSSFLLTPAVRWSAIQAPAAF